MRSRCLPCCLLLLVGAVVYASPLACNSGSLARYRLTFTAKWTQEDFPKQFPQVRPPAQWSKLVGRSHNDDYELWTEGGLASFAMKHFAQDGNSDYLDRDIQGFNGVFDSFYAPPIKAGTGETVADFIAVGNFSKVSAAVKIIPSPDWFVGIDSVMLCQNGSWMKTMTIPLSPYDAGTDRGFTFTSPNWASRPRQNVFQITSKFPDHPANSFFYPELDSLPEIGSISIQLLDTFRHVEQVSDVSHTRVVDIDVLSGDFFEMQKEKQEEAQIVGGEPLSSKPKKKVSRRKKVLKRVKPDDQTTKRRKHHKITDCRVSPWQPWSPCSKSCGFGAKSRVRTVIQKPHRGRSCPKLKEERWCGSARNCESNYFSWVKKKETS